MEVPCPDMYGYFTGGYPPVARTLSHSSFQSYRECSLKWRFKYIDRIPDAPRHYFSFGYAVHSGLEAMYTGDACPDLAGVVGAYEAAWTGAGYADPKKEAKARIEGAGMVADYYRRFSPHWRKPLAVEMKFTIPFGAVQVTGYIDRVDRVEGGLRVVDYKTGKSWEPGRAQQDQQLTLYQHAVETVYGSPVASMALLHVPTLESDESGRHLDTVVQELVALYERAAARIVAGEFGPTPSELACGRCERKGLCPEWRPQ